MEQINTVRWKLDNLQGGLDLESFKDKLMIINEQLTKIQTDITKFKISENELITLSKVIKQIESAESLYYCLTTEDVDQNILSPLIGNISALKSKIRVILSIAQVNLNNMSEEQFTNWSKDITQINLLNEIKKNKEKGSRVEKNRLNESLHSLAATYRQMKRDLKVKNVYESEDKEISYSEANYLSFNDPDHNKRRRVFEELNRSLEKEANSFASIYNQMVGIRLKDGKKNVSVLDESLKLNGISKQILNAIWGVLDANITEISSYLRIKSEELGKEKLSWYELMSSTVEEYPPFHFSEAVKGLTKSLENIDSNMIEFINKCIRNGWVDAEPRNTKQPGGFCAPFLDEGESRISLSFDNTIDSARRLAHELGHAWHYQQMKDAPSLCFTDDSFELTMAETASIFFETVYLDYIAQSTNDLAAKKIYLESNIQRCLNYLMNIRGAFLFEEKFYELRKNGDVDPVQMEQLSLKCQEQAYGNSLSEYEPFVWIKYDHFYQADTPFYNYPYVFGFLFSIGIIEIAKKDELFAERFQEFLSETGVIPLDQLVKKHFDIDLAKPNFWQGSIKKFLKDIQDYIKLAKKGY
ncbi:M3 family metallopeptidase [Psychrobacillus antarcticus]|uniref:M3 family metallopeptidase n=1 Tax=Psychrobacillus antarcticus TaxID=2879115 RepID=UPI00240840DF|nr:M3 family metallopeptidase [Psychrobacillus antarcticus]